MLYEEAEKVIKEILGEQVTFEGHFNEVFDNLKQGRKKRLIKWVKNCKEGRTRAISSDKTRDLLGFILKFRNTNFRAILTKKKNEYFIALFLDKHKYYENERRKLGI